MKLDSFDIFYAQEEKRKEQQRVRNLRYRDKINKEMKPFIVPDGLWGDIDYSIFTPPPVKSKSSKALQREKFQAKYPLKAKAHKMVRNALLSGKLVRQCCEVCDKYLGVDAHHDDYSKPLEIRWLCRAHHSEWHQNNKAKYDPAWEDQSAQKLRKKEIKPRKVVGDDRLELPTLSV